ncbi:acylneuraminate cytidylyltransferase family protein [Methylophilaceae bacterium]|nr:acylneuraminate cytidylyltransferase family protein [Methylophilaceae bacterium]
MKIIALIPARSGSKSVPGKNIRKLCGKPLLSYTIKTALESKLIDRVIVTTDSQEISNIAKEYGAEVPFLRPKKISGDYSLDLNFHEHAINWLKENENYTPDLIVNLRPTNPIRKTATVDKAIQILIDNPDMDSLRSVRISEFSPFKMWTISHKGMLEPITSGSEFHEPYNMPRQLLPKCYWQDGYVDVARYSTIVQKISTTGKKIIPFLIEEESVDIDYEESVRQVENILSGKPKNHGIKSISFSEKNKRNPS